MLTATCGADNPVPRSVWLACLTDNNFGAAAFCVDNPPVAPEKATALSTGTQNGFSGGAHPLAGMKKPAILAEGGF